MYKRQTILCITQRHRGCSHLSNLEVNQIVAFLGGIVIEPDDEKEIALLYAKGEYIEYATGRQFALVVRENEFCVLRYYIEMCIRDRAWFICRKTD